MSDTCVKHSFEPAAGVCRQCHNSYCTECLVYAFGESKPPYCVECALMVAGIRQAGAKPNPRLRKKGLFRRKVLVDEAPKAELGFTDVEIGLPDNAYSSPAMARLDTSGRVGDHVVTTDAGIHGTERPEMAEVGAVAVATSPDQASDSLAGWAASLGADDETSAPATPEAEPWPEPRKTTSSFSGWPDD